MGRSLARSAALFLLEKRAAKFRADDRSKASRQRLSSSASNGAALSTSARSVCDNFQRDQEPTRFAQQKACRKHRLGSLARDGNRIAQQLPSGYAHKTRTLLSTGDAEHLAKRQLGQRNWHHERLGELWRCRIRRNSPNQMRKPRSVDLAQE